MQLRNPPPIRQQNAEVGRGTRREGAAPRRQKQGLGMLALAELVLIGICPDNPDEALTSIKSLWSRVDEFCRACSAQGRAGFHGRWMRLQPRSHAESDASFSLDPFASSTDNATPQACFLVHAASMPQTDRIQVAPTCRISAYDRPRCPCIQPELRRCQIVTALVSQQYMSVPGPRSSRWSCRSSPPAWRHSRRNRNARMAGSATARTPGRGPSEPCCLHRK